MAKFDMTVAVKNNAGTPLGSSITVTNKSTKTEAEQAVDAVLEQRSNAATANAAEYADALAAFRS